MGNLLPMLIEPYRKQLIPHFDDVKSAVIEAGALGCAISGSGPSIFTLSKGEATADAVKKAMQSVYSKSDIQFETYVSKINVEGIKTIN